MFWLFFGAQRLDNALSEIAAHLGRIARELTVMSEKMANLENEVAETKTVVESAVVLITGLAERIREAGVDQEKLTALADDLDATNQRLAGAVAANTPAAPADPEPAPTPDTV